MTTATKNIINKLENLPENLLLEVEDFIDFLKAKHTKNVDRAISNNIVNEPQSLYGSAKDLFIIPENFNEPLDDLKDYM